MKKRYDRVWYEEPPKPETGAYQFRIDHLLATSDRACHWPGGSGDEYFYEYEYDEPELTPEYSGKLDQCLSLKKINELVRNEGLDDKNIFFTASFSDDHLAIEVVHIYKLDEQGQLEEYKEEYSKWVKKQKLCKTQELKDIEYQIESLQRKAETLKSK